MAHRPLRIQLLYEIQHIPKKTNIPVDALSIPPNANQREQDNKNVTVIPPHKFVNLAIFNDDSIPLLSPKPKINEEWKCEIIVSTHTLISRTFWKRWNHPKSKIDSILGWNEHLDNKLHQGLHNMSTEQDSYASP